MNAWLVAAIALLPPLAVAVAAASFGMPSMRLVAVPFAGALVVLLLLLLPMAVAQPSFLDLALALAIASFPGLVVYAHFLERWL